MLLVDTNVLAYLLIEGDHTRAAQALYERDPEWRSEAFILVEFSNVLATYVRTRALARGGYTTTTRSVIRRDGVATSPGQFGWSGAFDTTWITDPREQLLAVLMAQRMAFGPSPTGIRPDFHTSGYQAIDD